MPAAVERATVRLELQSRPESLTLVRAMLAGLAKPLELEPELLSDVKTAVSEACNNVVLHAYPDRPGPLLVTLALTDECVEVVVRDRGCGIEQSAPSEGRMSVGLALIRTLARRAEYLDVPGGGTEARMLFARRSAHELDAEACRAHEPRSPEVSLSGDAVVTLAPVSLLAAPLGRVARAAAAWARFSVDRFSDLHLVTDAIAAYAQTATGAAEVSFAIAAADRRLEVTIGPLISGSGARLQVDPAAGAAWSPLSLLADEVIAEPIEGAEMLRVVLLDPGGPSVSAQQLLG